MALGQKLRNQIRRIMVKVLAKTRTPIRISPTVLKFCNQIVAEPELCFLNVIPSNWAIVNECFVNVERKIAKDGGSLQYGWQIWEWPLVMLEAEFHAVWVSPNGSLVDITPKQIPTTNILFLIDPIRQYYGQQVNNFRFPLQDNALIREYIKVCDEIYCEMNRGDMKTYHGSVAIPERLLRQKSLLSHRLMKIQPGRNDLCICGSGIKFKKCCGK